MYTQNLYLAENNGEKNLSGRTTPPPALHHAIQIGHCYLPRLPLQFLVQTCDLQFLLI